MTLYDSTQIADLISYYSEHGGQVYILVEGVLGYGLTVLHDESEKLCSFVIQERYLNEWSSSHTVRRYNKLPKKYAKMIENMERRITHE